MTPSRAQHILNSEAGWEKYSLAEAEALAGGLLVLLRAVRSIPAERYPAMLDEVEEAEYQVMEESTVYKPSGDGAAGSQPMHLVRKHHG